MNEHESYQVYKKLKDEKEERIKKDTRDRFETILRKKFQTTFIGSISDIEEVFGFLWGHGIEYNQLDDQEREYRDMWDMLRNRILDRGNAQIRAVQKELLNHELKYVGQTMRFERDKDGILKRKD